VSRAIVSYGMMLGLVMLVLLGFSSLFLMQQVETSTVVQHASQVAAIDRVYTFNIELNREHAHADALVALDNYGRGICDDKQVYFEPNGRVMISCRISGTDTCLMVIFRVTESVFDVMVPMSPGLNTHASIRRCGYISTYQVDKIGYTPWEQVAADIRDMITSAFGEP